MQVRIDIPFREGEEENYEVVILDRTFDSFEKMSSKVIAQVL